MNILLTSQPLSLHKRQLMNDMSKKDWKLVFDGAHRGTLDSCMLMARPIVSPTYAWAPPRTHSGGELHETGLFYGGDVIGTTISPKSWDLYAGQIHAERLLTSQRLIPTSVRDYELVFPATRWRDNSNFPNGLRGEDIGYLCSPLLRWHWYDKEWALEWYWYADGVHDHQLSVELSK